MPVVVTNFAGGLRTDLSPLDIPEGCTPDCANVVFQRNTVQVRPGRALHATVPAGLPYDLRGLAQYSPPSGGEGPVRLVAVAGDTLYASDDAQQSFELPLTMDTTVNADNPVRFAQFGGRLYFVDGDGPVKKCFNLPGLEQHEVLEVRGMPPPLLAPAIGLSAAGPAPLAKGNYDFAYTYSRPSLSESESGFSKIASPFLNPWLKVWKSITVTAYEDAGVLEEDDVVSLYACTPYHPDQWVRYAQWVKGVNEHPWAFTFDTTKVAYSPLYDFLKPEYPPIGCTHLIEWRGRMVYVGWDTLFISNLGDADWTPQGAQVNPPPDYGAYLQVGADGLPVTGLARIGTFLVVFKADSVWLLDGDSWANFSLMRVHHSHGCISHESICETEQGILFLGRDSIYGFNGQTVEDVGKPVREKVAEIDLSVREKAIAVYDPATRRYLLVFPDGEAAGNSTALVFDLRAGGWTYWTDLPGGAVLLADRAVTGAVYAVDRNVNKVWRLMEGAADEAAGIYWYWRDNERSLPPAAYLDLQRVWVQFRSADVAMNSLVASVRRNGLSANYAWQALTLPETEPEEGEPNMGQPGVARWRPPIVPDMESCQLSLSGVSVAAFEVVRVDFELARKGELV